MPHEPLTPEERALAQSLSRLDPHGGPSPDLDARILGAARAAVQTAPAAGGRVSSHRRRWPLGMGVAASVLFAAGIAWQLRPVHEVPVASEVPMETERSSGVPADSARVVAADAAAPAAEMPAPPAAVTQEVAPPVPAKVLSSSPVERGVPASGPARQNAEAVARQAPAPKRSPLALIPAPASPPAPPASEAVPQAFPADADGYTTPAAAATAAVPEASVRERAQYRVAAQQEQEQRARHEEDQREAVAKAANQTDPSLDRISVTGSRVKSRERQARPQDAAPAPSPVLLPPPPPPPAASAGSVQPSAARNALRRTDLQVPVDADTRLPPDEWLDRIRLRRDLGDNATALRSLQLFVQEHPFQRVPDDLRPLLGTL
ncbi:hypothetical protein [Pseudoxanthomonas sp.]|uniref:hypothetical protein n=1 Tax=Pseudoxanthomonas sp. TaxID=1871049 RepID=UPI002FE389DF